MSASHITVVSIAPVVPASPDIPAATPADTAAGAPPFAAVLGERLDALIEPQGDAPREESADDARAPEAAAESPADAAIALLGGLPALTEARQWTPPPVRDEENGRSAAAPATLAAARLPTLASATAREPALAFAPGDAGATDLAIGETKTGNAARPLFELPAAAATHASASLAPALPSTPPPAPVITAPIATPVYSPDWPKAVSERISVFVRDRVHAAELHVNPPELGPVSVRIDVSGNEANLVFGVQQAETRNLLMESLPRLAETLAANGIALTGAQIGAEMPARRDWNGADAADAADPQDSPAIEPMAARLVSRGLVDVFA